MGFLLPDWPFLKEEKNLFTFSVPPKIIKIHYYKEWRNRNVSFTDNKITSKKIDMGLMEGLCLACWKHAEAEFTN